MQLFAAAGPQLFDIDVLTDMGLEYDERHRETFPAESGQALPRRLFFQILCPPDEARVLFIGLPGRSSQIQPLVQVLDGMDPAAGSFQDQG